MSPATIPLRNLIRKLPRTALSVVVFALGIASVVALVHLSRVAGDSLERTMTAYGANVLITPRTQTLSVSYGGLPLRDVSFDMRYLPVAETLAAVRSIPMKDTISVTAPKFALLTKVGGKPVGVVGVDFASERGIKRHWRPRGGYPASDEGVLVGSAAAAALGLDLGDPVVIEGRTFKTAGMLAATGSEDDNVIFADIGAVQRLAGKENLAHFVEVAALCSGCPIDEITAQIQAALPDASITAMQQVVRQRMDAIAFVKRLALSVSAVIMLTACAMIGLSVFSSVNERKNEIGVLRALGFSRSGVFLLFCLEAVIVGMAAAVLGYAGGAAAAGIVPDVLESGAAAAFAFDLGEFALTFAAVSVLSAAAAAPPSLAAARLDPAAALVSL
jgi:putative ABC transport system permease protein